MACAPPTRSDVAMTLLHDVFNPEPLPHWRRHLVGGATMERVEDAWRLQVGPSEDARYQDSQLDDSRARRDELPWEPPLRLAVRARFSHSASAWRGTAGFGWWNVPLQGDIATALGAGPQVLWFFVASPPNNLAFTDGWAGHGAFAQSLDFGRWPLWLLGPGALGLLLPGVRRLARRSAARLSKASEQPLPSLDITAWHDYAIQWHPDSARFLVDGDEIMQCTAPPRGPLSLILWADNQWASLSLRGGRLTVPEAQWLDVAEVQVEGV